MELSQSRIFLLTLAAGFLVPAVIPQIGLDYPYFFILAIVLFAWFIIKWDSVNAISVRSQPFEKLLALSAMVFLYAFKAYEGAPFGLIDLLLIFLGAIVFTYGLRSLRLFWVPVAYGVVLLAGYQIETLVPNFVALQDWLAGVLAGIVSALGISAIASGHEVTMILANGTPVLLDVSGDCTGLQGILAFGMLSTMTLLDFKPRMSRIVPIFAVGFIGAFLINIVRLLVVFLTFEFLGVDAGTTMHVYFGYLIFIAWVMVFWVVAFKYLAPVRGALPQQVAIATHLGK